MPHTFCSLATNLPLHDPSHMNLYLSTAAQMMLTARDMASSVPWTQNSLQERKPGIGDCFKVWEEISAPVALEISRMEQPSGPMMKPEARRVTRIRVPLQLILRFEHLENLGFVREKVKIEELSPPPPNEADEG